MAQSVSDVSIIGMGDGFPIAEELFHLLKADKSFHPTLRQSSAEEVPRIDFSTCPILVLVNPDEASLSRTIAQLTTQSSGGLHAFVDIFAESGHHQPLLAAGFDTVLTYPFVSEDIHARLKSALEKRQGATRSHAQQVTRNLTLEVGLNDLIGSSPRFSKVLSEIKVLAAVDATVLITGETGTGKDICARTIHYASARASSPFLPVNCGAIPDELFANELFGHERGAFTDARWRHAGLIQQAEGGTLFLDDVDALSMSNQARLLRFLQGNEYSPLGLGKPLRADVRIIAATNADLAERVKARSFREDVYFRLAVLTLVLPPLRERKDDIPALASHLVTRYSMCYGKSIPSFSSNALQKLSAYNWPGNVRELENVIHRAVVHASSAVLADADIDLDRTRQSPLSPDSTTLPYDQAREEVLTSFEREYVITLLRMCGGNITRAAKRAGKHRRSFWEIMRKHNISRSIL